MMDLADIRKKARTQESPVILDSLLPTEVLTADITVPVSLSVEQTASSSFLSEIGIEQFSTEEEYLQGLSETDGEHETDQIQWLGFYLGKEEYALDLEVVSELIKPRALTELPQVPAYVCGIITLRGEVIPVVDLISRLGLQHDDYCDIDLQRVIVCEGKEQRVGLLVDRISQVVQLSADSIEKPHLVSDNPATAFVLGVGRKQGRMLIQLHPERIVAIEEEVGV